MLPNSVPLMTKLVTFTTSHVTDVNVQLDTNPQYFEVMYHHNVRLLDFDSLYQTIVKQTLYVSMPTCTCALFGVKSQGIGS